MVKNKIKVVWSDDAKSQLKAAYKFIAADSIKNAGKIRSEILSLTKNLSENPERYSKDKFKLNNDGTYRAFEKYKYRISYRVFESEIRILRMRHTKMEPQLH